MKITKGRQITDGDQAQLSEFYFSITDCLNALEKMNYVHEACSVDMLRQVIKRLPSRLQYKWAEYSYTLRLTQEPTLYHLERWLQCRVMAMRDPYLPNMKKGKDAENPIHVGTNFAEDEKRNDDSQKQSRGGQRQRKDSHKEKGDNHKTTAHCIICKNDHPISNCTSFEEMAPEERLVLAKRKKLCFNCLGRFHMTRICKSKRHCFKKDCNKRHHTLLHDALVQPPEDTPQEVLDENEKAEGNKNVGENTEKVGENPGEPNKVVNGHINSEERHVFLQIVPVTITNKEGNHPIKTYALLDTGSQVTLIRDDIANATGLNGEPQKVKMGTIKDKEEFMTLAKVSFIVTAPEECHDIEVQSAYAVPKDRFNLPAQKLPKDFLTNPKYQHLQNIGIKNIKESEVTVLLGADVPDVMAPLEIRKGDKDSPVAVKTSLGWTLMGVLRDVSSSKSFHSLHTSFETIADSYMEQFWTTEGFGTYKSSSCHSVEDMQALNKLQDETKLVNGKYQVPMLWKKNDEPELHNNYSLARKRFEYLQSKFRKDPGLEKMYRTSVNDYIEQGYAEHVCKDTTNETVWYLPHHPVTNPNKPGRVRAVFDAAASYKGKSLNDTLVTGPDLLNNLVGVITRFRRYPYVITGDVEAMFHQVRVPENERRYLRFLWSQNTNERPKVYQMTSHIFGAKDSPCCASYALRRTAVDNKDKYSAEAVKSINRDFYMDDLLKSLQSAEMAMSLIDEIPKLVKEGGFRLTKLYCNHAEVLHHVPVEERAKSKDARLESDVERTLGVYWDTKEDCFTFKLNVRESQMTKRGLLKVTSSIFDPLGFLSPFVLRAKILIQELWRQKVDWDEDLTDSMKTCWQEWLEELKQIQMFKLRRCFILDDECIDIQVHIFTDASDLAFGATAYLRVEKQNKEVDCLLIMSKSRLAPIKKLTTPRLELQGAVLGVRLSHHVDAEIDLQVSSINYWTDSKTVLQYLNNETKRFKTFVANRVQEIRDTTIPNQWRYVPGKENPADLATKPYPIADIIDGHKWKEGPLFLSNGPEFWPKQIHLDEISTDDKEIKVKSVLVIKKAENSCFEFDRYSCWKTLKRIMGWLLRFIHNISNKEKKTGKLSAQEISDAILKIVFVVQTEEFSCKKSRKKLLQLTPITDEKGLLRVGGRLKHASIPYSSKHQLILPKVNRVSELILCHYHNENAHGGYQHTLSVSRQKYWIIGGRTIAKRIVKRCIFCRKRDAKASIQLMADLPPERLGIMQPAFYNTGVDFFGPYQVKIKRSRHKRWGVLFTCLAIRAVHIEVCESLETDAFINVLRRFIAR